MPSACPGHRWVVRAAEKPGYEPSAPSSLNLRVSAGLFGPWTSLLLLVWSLPHGVVAPCQEPKIPRSYTRIFRLDGTLGGVARSPLAKERYQPLGHFSIGVSDRVRTGIDQIHGLALCIKLRSPLTFGTWRRLEGSNLHALTGIDFWHLAETGGIEPPRPYRHHRVQTGLASQPCESPRRNWWRG